MATEFTAMQAFIVAQRVSFRICVLARREPRVSIRLVAKIIRVTKGQLRMKVSTKVLVITCFQCVKFFVHLGKIRGIIFFI